MGGQITAISSGEAFCQQFLDSRHSASNFLTPCNLAGG